MTRWTLAKLTHLFTFNKPRTVNRYGYGNGDFCTLNCQNDWWKEHGTRAVDHAGRLTQPRVMTPENSWVKRWGYLNNDYDVRRHYYHNVCTQEQRSLTESQYNDTSYTLNT